MNRSEIALLLHRCQAGDGQAATQLVESYRPAVFRMALSILDDTSEADEAAQDTLIQALNHLDTYREEGSFTNWLYKITLNVCRGRLRKRRAGEKLAQALKTLFRMDNKVNPHPEDLIIQNEVDTTIWQAIRALPEKQRLTVILRYYHALPISEIAQVLQVSERTVHTRMRQAHSRLQVMLDGKVK